MIDENYEACGEPPHGSQKLVVDVNEDDENSFRVKTEPGTITVNKKSPDGPNIAKATPIHEGKQPGECRKCKLFANLSRFSLLDQKAIKTHVELEHNGKIQCCICNATARTTTMDFYTPSVFRCSNCTTVLRNSRSLKQESPQRRYERYVTQTFLVHLLTNVLM